MCSFQTARAISPHHHKRSLLRNFLMEVQRHSLALAERRLPMLAYIIVQAEMWTYT